MNIKSNKQVIYLSNKSKLNIDGANNIFKLTSIKRDRIIFENPSNAEEKKITYILKTPAVINILIEGTGTPVESYGLNKIIRK
jgi:hypothetical protein